MVSRKRSGTGRLTEASRKVKNGRQRKGRSKRRARKEMRSESTRKAR